MRLIDADAACEKCGAKAVGGCSDECVLFMDNLPTIDAVQVCRCKDCKRMNDVQFCVAWEGFVREDDFCSYGEKRNDDGTD